MNKHINEKNYKYLVTNDNWKTFKVTKKILNDSIPEENGDICQCVRLRNEFGDEKGRILINVLNRIRNEILKCSPEEDPGYGHSFEIFAIAVLYDLDFRFAYDKYIIKGTEDGGVDAIYYEDEILKIYQIKFREPKNDCTNKIENNIVEYQRDHTITEEKTKHLKEFLDINKNKIEEKKFDVIYICNNKRDSIESSKIFNKYFENTFIKHENSIVLKLKIEKNRKNKFSITNIDKQVFAFFYGANELINNLINAKGINSYENFYKYFDKNVRGNLKENKSMIKTISEEPYNFVKYNNGITITGDVNYNDQNGFLVIENPTISNGQQTVINLYNNKDKLENVKVLIIVKNDNNPSIVDRIAKYTNSQTKIKSIDLLSLDTEIRALQKSLYLKRGDFFLDINSSGTKNYSKMAIEIYGKNHIISLQEFLKLYYGSKDRKIGKWKNSISTQADELIIRGVEKFNTNEAIKVCETIIEWKEYSANDRKEEHRLSDLASMYISYKYGKSICESYELIDKITKKYVGKKRKYSNTKDLYRSIEIANIIDNELNSQ